jgi:hypothetical protein
MSNFVCVGFQVWMLDGLLHFKGVCRSRSRFQNRLLIRRVRARSLSLLLSLSLFALFGCLNFSSSVRDFLNRFAFGLVIVSICLRWI